MNIPTCFRCPKRHNPDDSWFDRKPFCELLVSKMNGVRGLGLTVIKFACPTRDGLFSPGDVVTFSLPVSYSPEGDARTVPMEGVIMRRIGRKWFLYSASEGCTQKVMKLYPDKLKKTGETRPLCIHCGLPMGVERPLMEYDKPWYCRTDYNDNTMEEVHLPCEAAIMDALGKVSK